MDTEMVKEIGVGKCALVGQLLLECWTTGGDVKLQDCPIGSNCLPVGGPSIDTVLANKGTRGPNDNVELNNPLWNIASEVKQKDVVLISDCVVAKGNHTGVSEPEKEILLVNVASGSESGQSLTYFMEVGPQQSQESRSVGGKMDREISGSPQFRKKCWWKHTQKKMWVECPFRERVGQIRTPAADGWPKGATAKCWWRHARKKWAYAANGLHRVVPFVRMSLCVPPSGSKQEGG